MFLWLIGKPRIPSGPLICWDIFDFFSGTAERILTKLHSKQILYVRYNRKKPTWPPQPLIGWNISQFSSSTAERNLTKRDRTQEHNVLYQVWVYGWIGKSGRVMTSDLLIFLNFSSATVECYSTKLDRRQVINALVANVYWNLSQVGKRSQIGIKSDRWRVVIVFYYMMFPLAL